MLRKFAVFTTFPEKNVYSEKMLQSLSMNWDKNISKWSCRITNISTFIKQPDYITY